MTAGGKWADLGPRLASGLAMVVIGAAAIWAGGWWFAALAVVASGLMVWELAAMTAPGEPRRRAAGPVRPGWRCWWR